MKALKHLIIKIIYIINTRKFKTSKNTILHYIFKKGTNDNLVVVFSGFAGHYKKARYNYIKTLKDSRSNCLFILDDFGYKKIGSYYLGTELELYSNDDIKEIVDYFYMKTNANKKTFIGSSKGGSAALIYGLKYKANLIIAGSPQYKIGWYLSLNDYHKLLLKSIIGNKYTADDLDNIIDDNIDKLGDHSSKIIIIYSSKEQESKDIEKLLVRLKNKKVELMIYDEKFDNHSSIANVFPKYINKI